RIVGEILVLVLNPALALYKTIWRRSFVHGDRFMTRTSSLAWVLLGLCLSRPALADKPTTIPRATTPQVHQVVDRATKYLQADGSWAFFAGLRRPPINESQTTDAAWIIMALQGQTGVVAPKAQREALAKAIAWLDTAKPSNLHQDKVMKVLLGVRSGKPRK